MYNHNHHQDVYTISNPMTYNSYANAMGNKATTVGQNQPAEMSHETWLQLNDSPLSTTDRNNGIDRKESNPDVSQRRSKVKYIINTVLLIIVILVISSVELGFLPNVKQPFVCEDPSISFKYKGDTIRPSVLGIVSVLMPFTIFLIVEYLRARNDWKKITSMMWRWCKCLVLGNIVINLFITEVLKTVFGELRPHFLDTCDPDAAKTCTKGELVEEYKCTSYNRFSSMMITDSSRSFPSGHASLSVFASVYCAAYIYYRYNNHSLGSVLKPFAISVTMLWGLACGITRITDHRHHWWDVLAGSLLGAVSALFTIFCIASKFRTKQRPSVSSTKLWDGRSNKDDVSV